MWHELAKDANCRKMTAKRMSLTNDFQVASFLQFSRTSPCKNNAKSNGKIVGKPRRNERKLVLA
jgi:hypothetical protein